jgi:hypothetical protein
MDINDALNPINPINIYIYGQYMGINNDVCIEYMDNTWVLMMH